MRQLFDFVVVDCGRNINEITVAAWERSDHLYYVLNQSIRAVRCAWRFLDLFGRLGINGVEPGFLLNCYNFPPDGERRPDLPYPGAAHLCADAA